MSVENKVDLKMDEKDAAKSGAVVVGIDGSRAAISAALWAIDEAVSRGVPLRLLYAIDPEGGKEIDPDRATRRFAVAENAVRCASMAIEAADKPVMIEVEITQERPIIALIRASASAAMVCIGAAGLGHFRPERVGSTAATLAVSAHCPVAVIRGNGDRVRRDARGIVLQIRESADTDGLYGTAIEQARLRKLPLRVIGFHGPALSNVDRRLERWRRRYPEVEVHTVLARGSLLRFISENACRIELVIVSAHNHEQVKQLMGPEGNCALRDAHCSVLIADHQHL